MAGMPRLPTKLKCEDYTVGWICGTSREFAVSILMLDEEHDPIPYGLQYDGNSYRLGRIHQHNVVITCLPPGFPGASPTKTVITQMLHTFQNIQFSLVIGTGGAAPAFQKDVRLGDVVVSFPTDRSDGLNKYELRMDHDGGYYYQRAMSLGKLPHSASAALSKLQAENYISPIRFDKLVAAILERNPNMRRDFSKPPDSEDNLFRPSYDHDPRDSTSCGSCDQSKIVSRSYRFYSTPLLHFGTICSTDDEVAEAPTRDLISEKDAIICFDTEAAQLPEKFSYLFVRGICDYTDSHRNDLWKCYASANAVALSKDYLSRLPSISAFSYPGWQEELVAVPTHPTLNTVPPVEPVEVPADPHEPPIEQPQHSDSSSAAASTPQEVPPRAQTGELSTWVLLGGLHSPAVTASPGPLSKRSSSLKDEMVELDIQIRVGNRHGVARFAKKFVADFKSPVHRGELCPRLLRELETNFARGNKLLGDEQGYTPLHHLATIWSDDCEEEIGLFVEGGANLEAQASLCCDGSRQHVGVTPLWLAARYDNTSALKHLIKSGARIEAPNSQNDRTPLHIACIERCRESVKLLLQAGASVNTEDEDRATPLLVSSRLGFSGKTWEIVHLLLRYGSAVDAVNDIGRSALHYAALDGDMQSMKELLAYGADITIKDLEGYTALSLALSHSDKVLRINMATLLKTKLLERADLYTMLPGRVMALIKEKRLLEAQFLIDEFGTQELSREGWLVDIRDSRNSPYLILAAAAGAINLVRSLIQANANLVASNNDGNTALHVAAECGHVDIVNELLEHFEDQITTNRAGNTPLHLAAAKGFSEILEILLRFECDHTISNKAGDTALMVAVSHNHAEAARRLIAATTDFEVQNKQGLTVFFMAIQVGNTEIINALIKAYENFKTSTFDNKPALVYAIEQEQDGIASCLINEGAKAKGIYNHEYNTLQAAIDNDLPLTVETLLKKDVYWFRKKYGPPGGVKSLRQATNKGFLEVVRVLVRYGANVNPNEEPPLCIAVENDFLEVAQELFEAGANVNCRSPTDRTPLMIAAENDNIEMVHMLLNRRADLSLRRADRTAADMAISEECKRILIA